MTRPSGARRGFSGTYRWPIRGGAVLLVLLLGFVVVTLINKRHERKTTLTRLPSQPALDASTRPLEPLLERAIEKVQASPTAQNLGQLGMIYQANYFYNEAIACYERVFELDPTNAQWPYLLAYLYNMKGRIDESSYLLDRAIELNPTHLPALLRRGDNRYKTGESASATEDYRRCLELNNNPYAHLGLGRIAADAGEWTAAEEHLQAAVKADRTFGIAHRLLATVYEKLGKEEEQQRAIRTADALPPFETSPDPLLEGIDKYCYHTERLLTRANRADRIKKFDEAQSFYKRVLAIEPENFFANAELGLLLQKMERYEEAAPLLEKALNLPAQDDYKRLGIINLLVGNNFYRLGAPEKAVPYYESALKHDGTIEDAHHSLTGCFLQLNRPRDAIVHCQEALKLNPESADAHYNWGQALLAMNDVETAVPHFAEAEKLDPTSLPADYMAGYHYFARGETEMAAPYLKRVLETVRKTGNVQLESRIEAMLQQ